jgi:GT2 family glycosyltransferase
VVFVDDDCWPTEEWLDELLSPFVDPEVGAVMGNVRIARSTFLGDSISALGFPGGGSAGYAVMFGVDENGRTKHFSTLNCAIRRDVIVRLGGFDERLTAGAEDKELSHRVSGAGVGIMFQPSAIVEHRARASLSEFSRWFFRRGKAVRQFSRIVPAGEAIRLRLMSYGQLLRMHVTDPKIVLIAPLLVASIVLQQAGYMREVLGESGNARARETDTAPEG